MRYGKGERDLVCLSHRFEFERPDGRRLTKTSTLVAYGEGEGGYSAMARTVGIPAAIAADLLLQGRVTEKGVVVPTSPALYEPILAVLESPAVGLHFTETEFENK